MNEKAMLISFDASLDEHIDVHVLLLRRSKTGRSLRRRAAMCAGTSAGTLIFVCMLLSQRSPSMLYVTAAGIIAAVPGLLCSLAYLPIYDLFVRRRLRRFLTEYLGSHGALRCYMALRSDGIWTRLNGVELMLPWHDAIGVIDTRAGIQVDFRSGIALARNRGFTTEEERRRFLETARKSMASASGASTAEKGASDEAQASE
jgi:hypothetical protein